MTAPKPEPDMSEAALAARLEQLRALYELMIYLRQAKPVSR